MNCVMIIICKFSKRITSMSEKLTWIAAEWVDVLLQRLDFVDWELLKVIISDRNSKFLFELWSTLFARFEVRLLYTIVYHSQIDEISERINQTLKIALRFHIQMLNDVKNWLKTFEAFQRHFNNIVDSTDKSFNETCYEFISLRSTNLLLELFSSQETTIRFHVNDFIAHIQILTKHIYDRKHQSIQMNVDQWALLRFHKEYSISFSIVFEFKLSQQYAKFLKIIEKIDNLTYKFALSQNWRIHSVFSIAHLEFSFFSFENSFRRVSQSAKFVFVKDDTKNVRFYEIEKLIISRQTKRRKIEYLVRWKDYKSEHDVWRNLSEFDNVKKLIAKFDRINDIDTRRRKRSKKTK